MRDPPGVVGVGGTSSFTAEESPPAPGVVDPPAKADSKSLRLPMERLVEERRMWGRLLVRWWACACACEVEERAKTSSK